MNEKLDSLFLTCYCAVRVGADIVDRTVGRVHVALFVAFWLSLCEEVIVRH